MDKIGRNDPCPCGSGKKFKKCHMGREEELVLGRMEHLPDGAAEKIVSLPAVEYGSINDIMSRLDLEKLAGAKVGVKFIDLEAYLKLGFVGREADKDLRNISAGQMINPFKTLEADPDHVYLAVSPAISDSTLVHQLAHALDYLAGSKSNPGLARPLSMELILPLELLEHPAEFGEWLHFLANELSVELDAEDTIVAYLHENKKLIPGDTIQSEDHDRIKAAAQGTLEFIQGHRMEIDERIKNRTGYLKDQAPTEKN